MGGHRSRWGIEAQRRSAVTLRVLVGWLLAFAVCLALPRVAHAFEVVPMCGDLGQSIEAPPPLYPGKGDVLAPIPCDATRHAVIATGTSNLPRELTQLPHLDRKLAVLTFQTLPRVQSIRLDVPPAQADEKRPGFAPTVERPPRDVVGAAS